PSYLFRFVLDLLSITFLSTPVRIFHTALDRRPAQTCSAPRACPKGCARRLPDPCYPHSPGIVRGKQLPQSWGVGRGFCCRAIRLRSRGAPNPVEELQFPVAHTPGDAVHP